MLLSHEDTARAAEAAAKGLTEVERIALGTRLILDAKQPDSWLTLRSAVRFIDNHAEMLLSDGLRAPDTTGPTIPATTQQSYGDRYSGAHTRQGMSGSRATSSRCAAWARVWHRVMAWDDRFSDSPIGMVVGGICMAILLAGCVLFAGGWP
jgi:hypothetical protein